MSQFIDHSKKMKNTTNNDFDKHVAHKLLTQTCYNSFYKYTYLTTKYFNYY